MFSSTSVYAYTDRCADCREVIFNAVQLSAGFVKKFWMNFHEILEGLCQVTQETSQCDPDGSHDMRPSLLPPSVTFDILMSKVTSDVGNFSPNFERCVVFRFRINGRHLARDRQTDGRTGVKHNAASYGKASGYRNSFHFL